MLDLAPVATSSFQPVVEISRSWIVTFDAAGVGQTVCVAMGDEAGVTAALDRSTSGMADVNEGLRFRHHMGALGTTEWQAYDDLRDAFAAARQAQADLEHVLAKGLNPITREPLVSANDGALSLAA